MEYEDRVSRVLCRMVRRLGMSPIAADNYSDFKKLYDEFNPRIILLSLDTPTNNQGELCQYLVEQKALATIILLSNMDEEKLLGFERNGRTAGLNMGGILRKPVDLTSVQTKLEELITPDQGNSFKKKVPCVPVVTLEPPSMRNRKEKKVLCNTVITERDMILTGTGSDMVRMRMMDSDPGQVLRVALFDLDHCTAPLKTMKCDHRSKELSISIPDRSWIHGHHQ